MSKKYKGVICRGCWELGTACGKCEKCIDTRQKHVNKCLKNEYKRMTIDRALWLADRNLSRGLGIDGISPEELIYMIFEGFEAETTQLKERIAELEAELKRKDEEESDLLAIAYLQGSGKTNRLKRFARKIYDELQELKSGAIAEHAGTINEIIDMMSIASYDTEAERFTATIKEKKQ